MPIKINYFAKSKGTSNSGLSSLFLGSGSGGYQMTLETDPVYSKSYAAKFNQVMLNIMQKLGIDSSTIGEDENQQEYYTISVDASLDMTNHNIVNVNELDASWIKVKTLDASKINTSFFTAENIDVSMLHSKKIYNDTSIVTKELDVSTIKSHNIDNLDNIITKNLTVTGQAHFFELIIDKIKAAGGSVLFTPADGFVIDKVESDHTGYWLLYRNKDDDGNARDNMWEVNDQALCMSFNQAKVGVNKNVSNKYYWTLVDQIKETTVNDDYSGIHVLSNVVDGTLNPEVGDNIVMCGHRGNDIPRQSAIYISAYNSLDHDLTAPFIAQYRGITDFNLSSHRQSYFDANGATFKGNVILGGGTSLEDYINGIEENLEEKINENTEKYSQFEWALDHCHYLTRFDLEGNLLVYEWYHLLHWGKNVTRNDLDDIIESEGLTFRLAVTNNFYHGDNGVNEWITNFCTINHIYHADSDIYGGVRFSGTVPKELFAFWESMYDGYRKSGYTTSACIYKNGKQLFRTEWYNVEYEPGALWEVNNELGIIRGLVGDTSGNLSEYLQTAEQISLKVENLEGEIGQLKVRADEIQSSVKDIDDNLESYITQHAGDIVLEVMKDGLTAAGLEINADGTNTFTGTVIANDFRVSTYGNLYGGASLTADQVMVITTWKNAKQVANISGTDIPNALSDLTDDMPVFLIRDPKNGSYYVLNPIKLINTKYDKIQNVYPSVNINAKTDYYKFGDDGKVYRDPDTTTELYDNQIFGIGKAKSFYAMDVAQGSITTDKGVILIEVNGIEVTEYKYNKTLASYSPTGNYWYYINSKTYQTTREDGHTTTVTFGGGYVKNSDIPGWYVSSNNKYTIGKTTYTASSTIYYVVPAGMGSSSYALGTNQLTDATRKPMLQPDDLIAPDQ